MNLLANTLLHSRNELAVPAGKLRAYVFAPVVTAWSLCGKTIMVTISD